jgi:hypothetical protein
MPMKLRNSQPNLTTTDPLGLVHIASTAVATFIWLREDAVHDIGSAFDYRPQLLAIDRLCDGGRAVPDQARDDLDRYPCVRQ